MAGDAAWEDAQKKNDVINGPMSIYELHAGSWKMKEDGVPYNYSELADQLVPYIKDMGYTHVELLPITEYPFDGSWGYQVSGYFAPTSRYGTPHDFMEFVDKLHAAGIGVILDWVPAHFPKDAYGLYMFDGAPAMRTPTPAAVSIKSGAPWCSTLVCRSGKLPVIQCAVLDRTVPCGRSACGRSGQRAVDYNAADGESEQNVKGGKENLEAIAFLQKCNTAILGRHPHKMMIAEESTAWPLVSKPAADGGLGFNFKWVEHGLDERYAQLHED